MYGINLSQILITDAMVFNKRLPTPAYVVMRASQVKEIKILKQRAVTTNPGTKTPIYPGRML